MTDPNLSPDGAYDELCSIMGLGIGPIGEVKRAEAVKFLGGLMYVPVEGVEAEHLEPDAAVIEGISDDVFFATLREATAAHDRPIGNTTNLTFDSDDPTGNVRALSSHIEQNRGKGGFNGTSN